MADRHRVACYSTLGVVLFASLVATAQERRLPAPVSGGPRWAALVIGNDAYSTMPLRNAVADARLMGQALREIGYQVQIVENATSSELARAVEQFTATLSSGDVGVFFYAGHAVEIDGSNYLLPVDFRATDRADVPYTSYAAQRVLDKLKEREVKVRWVILDACRNNPYAGRAAGGGLSKMVAARGEYIVFSTSPKRTASDSPNARNSLFTTTLAKALREPGLRIQEVFKRVQEGVDRESQGQQTPYAEDGVIGDFYPNAGVGAAGDLHRPGLQAPPSPPLDGLDFGDLEKQSQARQQWAAYQSRLGADFAKARHFESQAATADLKVAAWERFLSTYALDNPLSAEDERLRADAQVRLVRLREEAESQTTFSSPPATPLPAPGGEPQPGAARRNMKDGLQYVWIPAGVYQMGCVPGDDQCDDNEKPRHPVTLTRGYWLGRTEVTVGAYRRFVKETGRPMPDVNFKQDDSHPVVGVSWDEAKAFCEWSGGRLPTEAQWERGARGGREGLKYPWGDSLSHDQANYGKDECCGAWSFGRDRWKYTSPTGSFDATGFDLNDMTGNVLEWVSDWSEENGYSSAPSLDPRGPANGKYRVLRGGSWNGNPKGLRVSFRSWVGPFDRGVNFGLRCSRDAVP